MATSKPHPKVQLLENFFQLINLKKENYLLKKRIKVLESDIIHDSLTGLKTRKFFYEELGRNLKMIFDHDHHHRTENFGFTKITVLFIDIDNFKKINDTYGHDVGDKVLKAVAKIINGKIWDRDIAARLGGEEIAIMFLGADELEGYEKAERIREKIATIKINDYEKLKTSVSIGVAQAKSQSLDRVLKEADTAMYKAKTTGKNKTIKFSDIIHKNGKHHRTTHKG